jgi:hypothetical protein
LHKRSHAFPRFAHADDPNDDETSDDPNDDDDAWDDVSGDDDPDDIPIIAWLWVTVPYLNAPECALITWSAPTSPPFVMGQRLRC